MKKLFIIIFVICYMPSSVFADYVDNKLPDDTPVSIKDGARQLIELGVNRRHVVKITKRMFESGFEENQVLSAFTILKNAKTEGLPEDPIMERLKEGIAKNVRAADILQAMDTVRFRYESANDYAKILSGDSKHILSMTEEIAECMAAGIENNDIGKVSEILRQKTETMRESKAETLNKRTFKAMKTMARTGVGSSDVFSVMVSAFQKGYGPNEMEGLEDSFQLNANWTSSVSDLAKSYAAAIQNGSTFEPMDGSNQQGIGFGPGMPGGGMPPGGRGGIPPGGPGGNPLPGPGGGNPPPGNTGIAGSEGTEPLPPSAPPPPPAGN